MVSFPKSPLKRMKRHFQNLYQSHQAANAAAQPEEEPLPNPALPKPSLSSQHPETSAQFGTLSPAPHSGERG